MNAAISSDVHEEPEDFSIKNMKSHKKSEHHIPKGILTKENYEQLLVGMSYQEAVKILGAEGKWESERKNTDIHSITYEFSEKGLKGIKISLAFLNGELSHKDYYRGTPDISETPITADQFDQVKSDMTYEEIVKVIGGEGILISEYGFPDGDYYTQIYKYSGISSDSEAFFTLDQGKMKSKSQYRLE